MRPTLASLIRIRPQTLSELGEKAASLRLPPSSAGAVAASVAQTSSRQRSKGREESTAERLLAEGETPSNLRFEKHVSNKEMFWNMPKDKREPLKKLLRES
ncbi:hypothetical protein FA10DRAFT_301378 [Acaromyces ingoldii]|uniref:Uncharacterized protein n=1 Tax=Acaromyces ingoldii TaxID=215250 RepID=A0A316YL25_9BASI|nr:hypothetical protein FA10DRAFT_301378 [Acaromyces ingoldii]PWN90097.1 hypothetical protein FA10DRAFT_301378 [Acaromyces ingoldii]